MTIAFVHATNNRKIKLPNVKLVPPALANLARNFATYTTSVTEESLLLPPPFSETQAARIAAPSFNALTNSTCHAQ